MGKREYSGYQQNVIKRYYENIDGIMLGKVQELVTELYLAKNGAKEDKLWERVGKALVKLKIKPAMIEHIMTKRSVEVLAQHVQDWSK